MKPFVYLMAALLMIATAEAKKGNNQAQKKAQQEEAKKKKERAERSDKRDKIDDYLKDRDGNNDGSLSLDEFLVGEGDVAAATKKFNDANKNHDRYLSKGEISDMLGL